ncbi:MAG: DnaA ATPase domain-containing protein, partial [Nocardioides sp.]
MDHPRTDPSAPDPTPADEPPTDLHAAWRGVLDELQGYQRAWLRTSQPVTLHENTAIIAVPNEFTRGQLEGRLRAELEESLTVAFGREIRIAVTVDPSLETGEGTSAQPTIDESSNRHDDKSTHVFDSRGPSAAPAADPMHGMPTAPANAPSGTSLETRLNPKYTFETFVIGSSNRFPHAAAVAVAEAPGKAYNPLLVYGESGLGKTHLLHAIGHYVRSLYTGAKVRYVSSEEFTNEFINAIRDDRQDRFKRRYRDVDVLLIDDIQFLEGKTQTQEEFFHTFNTLHNANKQIVLTSDRPPKRLEAL